MVRTRYLVAAILVVHGCHRAPSSPWYEAAGERPIVRSAPVSDLQFNDPELQAIATNLVREARARGVGESSGRNRIERLLSLEASLGKSERALNRVDVLVARFTATDGSQWARLRRKAESEFSARTDPAAMRVRDLLLRWKRERFESASDYLSTNYETHIVTIEWERRFHDFVARRPADAATWGWLVLRDYAEITRQQYGRADPESAYRFYIESSGLGDGRESRELFSVPGIDVR